MGSARGAESLKTVVNETGAHEECAILDEQLDELCKSCWAFIELPVIFQNAESFHHARKDRDRGKIHSAFTLDLDESVPAKAASVNLAGLTSKLDQVLGLGRAPRLSAIDLPETETYPASVMLIVRHGADLSSVYEHRDDGTRHALYFRPQDEIVLIYTPLNQRIEVLGRSFGQRHDVSNAFAEIVLGHNISEKPLSEKVYDLGRFASSFELDIPEIEVLCAGPEAPRFLANNVAIPVQEVWQSDSTSPGLLVDHMLDRLNAERRLIAENTRARVVRSGPHTGSLVMPRKEALPLSSPVQLEFFEKLARAYNSDAPEVHSSDLVEGTSARTPREIFTGKMRERVFASYVGKGTGKGMWRLMD
jgi:hypothetical protein